jgi:hypothetical protein
MLTFMFSDIRLATAESFRYLLVRVGEFGHVSFLNFWGVCNGLIGLYIFDILGFWFLVCLWV